MTQRYLLVMLLGVVSGCSTASSLPCWIDGSPCLPVQPTGQSSCYDSSGVISCPGTGGGPACASTPFCGQDVQYPDKARTFTVHDVGGEKAVADSLSHLVWQQAFTAGKTWQGAIDYCNTLSYAGETGWRLPDFHELAGIVNYGRNSPAIDTAAFPGTPADWFWSSSPYAYHGTFDLNIDAAFDVDFGLGSVEIGDKEKNFKSVRCMRGETIVAQGSERFVVAGSPGQEVVEDQATGLVWQKEGGTGTWQEALSYCEGLSNGGKDDWRLPNINELRSLVNIQKFDPASDFPGMVSMVSDDRFWSSSSYVNDPRYAWQVYFGTGRVYNDDKNSSRIVRCVSGGTHR